jgi:hypothetical protein
MDKQPIIEEYRAIVEKAVREGMTLTELVALLTETFARIDGEAYAFRRPPRRR